jgi:NitT/TauT family transport system ATP-binding protein
MAKVEIRGVSKSYALNTGKGGSDSVLALKGIDLTIEDGEFVALLGPSGCGKSTLLHLVAALEEATTGSILVDGEAPARLRDQHRLGIAFQDSALLPWLSVKANVALPYKIAGRPVDLARVRHLIQLAGLEAFADARPSQLSGGMRQRAAIARALTLEPTLLLLDEPFGALDAVTRRRMNLELQQIFLQRTLTTLMVTHSVDEALFLADRVMVMSGRPGQIVETIAVPFPRPRGIDCMRLEQFHQLTDHLTLLLEP